MIFFCITVRLRILFVQEWTSGAVLMLNTHISSDSTNLAFFSVDKSKVEEGRHAYELHHNHTADSQKTTGRLATVRIRGEHHEFCICFSGGSTH